VKYFAMITFGHNGKTIAGGSIFDPKDMGFSFNEIDFLKSTGKIIIAPNKPVEKKEKPKTVSYVKQEIPLVIDLETIEEPVVELSEELEVTEDVVIIPKEEIHAESKSTKKVVKKKRDRKI